MLLRQIDIIKGANVSQWYIFNSFKPVKREGYLKIPYYCSKDLLNQVEAHYLHSISQKSISSLNKNRSRECYERMTEYLKKVNELNEN